MIGCEGIKGKKNFAMYGSIDLVQARNDLFLHNGLDALSYIFVQILYEFLL
jgi:hypothetical protein